VLWKKIAKICSYSVGFSIGIVALLDLVLGKNYLALSSNIWQLFGLSIAFFALANVDKIKELTFKVGEDKEVVIKIKDIESHTSIEYKNEKGNREILYYYTKNIPLKIWDEDGLKYDAINDLIVLLKKDPEGNKKIIDSINNLKVLLENHRVKSLEDYGTNSNGTFIRINEGQAACIGAFITTNYAIQNINVTFPVAFSTIPNVIIVNKKEYINISNISRTGFSISINAERPEANTYNYIAHD
jgi:hypothetical protein